MTIDRDAVPRRAPGRVRRLIGHLGWVLIGVVLTLVLIANPLRLHAPDHWIESLLDRWRATGAEMGEPAQRWTCSMHPQVVQDQPGKCPICGMDLVPLRTGEASATTPRSAGGERKVLFYRNPMNPAITSPVPAKDEMGMDYVPVYQDEAEEAAGQGATVTIDPALAQNMNVRTERVQRRDLRREIRTVGYLEYDQQKMVTVTTKYAGWVETVFVNYIGEPVKRGQRLFQIYSPELVQTQQDLLSALAFTRRMEGAREEARRRAQSLVDSTRQRLAYWDITPAQIERLTTSGEVLRTLVVTAPADGVVMKRMEGLDGMAVRPGMELFHLADLSSLWLSVEVFEDQLAWLKPGSEAHIALSYFPGETFSGRVRFVEPQVSEKTRTVPLRLEVPNRDGRLRSGMYATVTFEPVVAKDAVVVPELAILRTGERNVVVVQTGRGRFTPREVVLGRRGEGSVEVVSGLREGEQIVTSSQFLIDSESNLREALLKMVAATKGE